MSEYSDILETLEESPVRAYNDKILIVDAMNMLIRSFSLIKSMNPSGHHIGGLVGFLRSLGYINRIFDPTRIIIVWDGKGGSANRKNIDPNYKAQRASSRITHWGLYESKKEEMEALIGQLERTRDYLQCLPVHQLMMEKLEADDVIAHLAKEADKNNKKCLIVSSDKDFLQLVNENIEVYAPIKKRVIDSSNIEAELQVLPENYNIVKALLGDKSDNLAGIKGLGIKTVIKEFPKINTEKGLTLDYIYEVAEEKLEGKKIFAKIIHNWDRVLTNYKLMNLHTTVLDAKEKLHIFRELGTRPSTIQLGVFLHLLDTDKIEGITKNTPDWLQGFSNLTNHST